MWAVVVVTGAEGADRKGEVAKKSKSAAVECLLLLGAVSAGASKKLKLSLGA